MRARHLVTLGSFLLFAAIQSFVVQPPAALARSPQCTPPPPPPPDPPIGEDHNGDFIILDLTHGPASTMPTPPQQPGAQSPGPASSGARALGPKTSTAGRKRRSNAVDLWESWWQHNQHTFVHVRPQRVSPSLRTAPTRTCGTRWLSASASWASRAPARA